MAQCYTQPKSSERIHPKISSCLNLFVLRLVRNIIIVRLFLSNYHFLIWCAIRKKGLSDICVRCRLGLACAIRAG